jgi:hypothetical protein
MAILNVLYLPGEPVQCARARAVALNRCAANIYRMILNSSTIRELVVLNQDSTPLRSYCGCRFLKVLRNNVENVIKFGSVLE